MVDFLICVEKMSEQLEDLDLGCGGGGGDNISDVFQRAGLAATSNLKQISNNQNLQTSLRLPASCGGPIIRKRRSVPGGKSL